MAAEGMSGAPGADACGHEEAREPLLTVGDGPLLWRGAALGGLAAVLGAGAVKLAKASVLLAPGAALLGLGAVLAGWAALVHLTGGERFDDGGCD